MNKLERLLNLTAALLDTRRPLTAEDLRKRVEGYPPPGAAFHRTFERDKEDLRVMGIPLRVERISASDPPVDGYRIDPDDYYLADPGLQPDELAALHLASLTVRLEGQSDREALWKLGGVDNADLGLAGDHTVASLPSDPALVPLFQAIVDHHQVRFTYRSEDRAVDPWRLDFERGRWYLTGYDHLRRGRRNYRLDRIDGGIMVTGPADGEARPNPTDGRGPLPPWELGDDEPTVATVRIDAEHVGSARRQVGPEVPVALQADGSGIFSIPVINFDAFRTFLFGFLDHAELLEPEAWRLEIIEWLTSMVDAAGGPMPGGPDEQ